ncbi:MAG: hypothetical protein PVG14_00615 [Anaerolineales bacterium]|jgi:hypothetical protein
MRKTTREILTEATLSREDIDRFLNPNVPNMATFDAELGYLFRDIVMKDGISGSYTISHYKPAGERRMVNYSQQPCRINTYGNSFTQGAQVSDGETWQEILATHFGEPIRNFGVGGYGVYQAYRRLLRQENTASSAEYIILNIWSDDHFRSIYPWRWLHIPEFRTRKKDRTPMFHANPWAHLVLNPRTGVFEEHENPYPTPESLYQLCDPDHVYEVFKDKFDVQTYLAQMRALDTNTEILQEMADLLDLTTDFSSTDATARTTHALLRTVALRSSMYVIDMVQKFIRTRGKKFLVLLSYSEQDVIRACRGLARFDQSFIDYLNRNDFQFIDTLQKHVADFRDFKCPAEEYTRRFYIGHYNPSGNHFFAFAIKDGLVDWLNPKPPAYRKNGPSLQSLIDSRA